LAQAHVATRLPHRIFFLSSFLFEATFGSHQHQYPFHDTTHALAINYPGTTWENLLQIRATNTWYGHLRRIHLPLSPTHHRRLVIRKPLPAIMYSAFAVPAPRYGPIFGAPLKLLGEAATAARSKWNCKGPRSLVRQVLRTPTKPIGCWEETPQSHRKGKLCFWLKTTTLCRLARRIKGYLQRSF
jgi:hypothetical protein